MLKLKKAAITGGLSCGKSSVCRFLKELGAYVVSADEIVHQLLSPKTTLGQKIVVLLGPDVLSSERFDRAKIAKKVFHQPELLRAYEELLHPAVREEMERQYKKISGEGHFSLFVAEIPLLFETGADSYYDATVVVAADPEVCKRRFGHPQDYNARMARQLSLQEKISRADYIIENNGTLDQLKEATIKLYHQLIN